VSGIFWLGMGGLSSSSRGVSNAHLWPAKRGRERDRIRMSKKYKQGRHYVYDIPMLFFSKYRPLGLFYLDDMA
jgi:hypothetical protein